MLLTLLQFLKDFLLANTFLRLDLIGSDTNEYLMKIQDESSYNFTTFTERKVISDMKEKLTYLVVDDQQERATGVAGSSLEEIY